MKPQLGHRVVPSLLVRDIDESVRFYARLGFSASGYHPDRHRPAWVELRCGEIVMQLYAEPPQGTPTEPVLSGTLYLFPDDVAALAEALRGVIEFAWGPQTLPWGQHEFAVRDPNGYLIAFAGAA